MELFVWVIIFLFGLYFVDWFSVWMNPDELESGPQIDEDEMG